MTLSFIVTSDLSSQKIMEYETSVKEIQLAIDNSQKQQSMIMGTISSRQLSSPHDCKNEVEKCTKTLKSIKIKINRLQEALPHIAELNSIRGAFELLKTLRISYFDCKQHNKRLIALKDSEQFKKIYLLSKSTMVKVEKSLSLKNKDSEIEKIFNEISPVITTQITELQSLQNKYLISQIHSCQVELLSFIAAKAQNLSAKIKPIITTIQISSNTSSNPLPAETYNTIFPKDSSTLPAHLRFQNTSGMQHWITTYILHPSIKKEVEELETIAKDLYICQTNLRKIIIKELSLPTIAGQESSSLIEEEKRYRGHILKMKSHIEKICSNVSSTQTASTVHPGVYYGSRLQEFIQEVQEALDRFQALISNKSTLLKIPFQLFQHIETLPIYKESTQVQYKHKKIEIVNTMVNLLKPYDPPSGKEFVNKELKNTYTFCHQAIAKIGSTVLLEIGNGNFYEKLLKRESLDIANVPMSAVYLTQEALFRRYFSAKPKWQLNMMLHNAWLYPNVVGLTNQQKKILEIDHLPSSYNIFSKFFYELKRYQRQPLYHIHYMYFYSQYALAIEEQRTLQKHDVELVNAASEQLEELRTHFQFPKLLPKSSKESSSSIGLPDDLVDDNDENKKFTLYARGLGGTPTENKLAIEQLDSKQQKGAPEESPTVKSMKHFFILSSFSKGELKNIQQLCEPLKNYLKDDATTIGFRNNFGYIFCEKTLYSYTKQYPQDSLETMITTRRGSNGFPTWKASMEIFSDDKATSTEKKNKITQLIQNGAGQHYRPLIEACLDELEKQINTTKKQII